MKTKKGISLIMSLAMVAGLASCSKQPNNNITINPSYNYEVDNENSKFEEPIISTLEKDEENVICEVANNGYVTCSDSNFALSSSLKQKFINTINNFDKEDIAFKVKDASTGTTFGYNTAEPFNGACIVKTSVILYLLMLAEQGKVNLGKTIPYPGNVVSGSGYLNGYYNGYQAYTGKPITILEYMYHSLYYSDNNGYRVLWKYLVNSGYYNNYKTFMTNINAQSLCVGTNIMWVRGATATAGANVMKATRDFCHSSEKKYNANYKFVDGNNLKTMSGAKYNMFTYGQIIYWIMRYSKYDYFEQRTGKKAITKTGFVSGSGDYSCRNAITIFYTNNRIVYACVLTKFHSADKRTVAMNSMIDCIDLLAKEYNNYLAKTNKTIVYTNYKRS